MEDFSNSHDNLGLFVLYLQFYVHTGLRINERGSYPKQEW